MNHLQIIAQQTGCSLASVTTTAKLIAEGATVPFIARYRKEQTGSLDEVQIATIRDRMQQLAELDSRRSAVIRSLEERQLLTAELQKKLQAAVTLTELEDIFAPYRPKRQTRATIAIERGLEPLANWLLAHPKDDPAEQAVLFIDAAKQVATADGALAGARDIIAERVADDASLRGLVRTLYQENAMVSSKVLFGKEEQEDAQKYRDYFQWSESLPSIPSREALKQVPRLGPKAFEQAAGFLRIRGAENPLDASGVHPERYALVEKMAADLNCSVKDLIAQEALRKRIQLEKYTQSDEIGLPTLRDILAELAKPGRDPRREFEHFSFQQGVEKLEDLEVGMKLPGVVTNATAFGAFIDVGVHQDGLVHVSQLADHFVKDASEVVKVGQKVMVTVVEVDLKRRRIALSMKSRIDFENRRSPANGGNAGSERDRKLQASRGNAPAANHDWFSQAMQQAKKK